jgi:predicted nucleotidyltransferase
MGGRVDIGGQLLDSSAISTFLRTGDRTLVLTELGRIDVLQGLPQIPPFAPLEEDATDVEMDGIVVRVCSLDHLLAMKRASGRPRDRDDLEALEAAQESENQGG